MPALTRRNALILGGLGVAGVAVGGTAFFVNRQGTVEVSGAVSGTDFTQPAELQSVDGRLSTTLRPSRRDVSIAGRKVQACSYTGDVPGPTLRVRAGDTLSVSLRNDLSEATNLHVHGLHVSPEGNGDNMFVSVAAGDRFDYEYTLPADHPPGVYWYHPHQHGLVADQVFSGLYGAIIVEDPVAIAASRERLLVVSDITFDGAGTIASSGAMDVMAGREGELVLVNGQLQPALRARPGERERWRIVNACVSRYLRLRLDGQRMTLLGIDSDRFGSPQEVEEIVLAPGNRADLLVSTSAGTGALRSLYFDRGASGGGMMGGGGSGGMMGSGIGSGMGGGSNGGSTSTSGVVLATLTVDGEAGDDLAPVPAQPAQRDLRPNGVTARREFVFAMGMGGGMGGGGGMMSATINGQVFDAARVDTTVQFDSVEEWLLTNTSTLDHPLHLHVWPMQIVEEGGRPVESVRWQDVVNVPARGSVRVRIAFEDFSGLSVYHCHILDHEDAGMMGVINTYPPRV